MTVTPAFPPANADVPVRGVEPAGAPVTVQFNVPGPPVNVVVDVFVTDGVEAQ